MVINYLLMLEDESLVQSNKINDIFDLRAVGVFVDGICGFVIKHTDEGSFYVYCHEDEVKWIINSTEIFKIIISDMNLLTQFRDSH